MITAADSGGPTEIVENGATGFVIPPEASALAETITQLLEDPVLAERMGATGYERYKNITWPETVRRLLA